VRGQLARPKDVAKQGAKDLAPIAGRLTYSPSLREGSFPETGLPLNNVLENLKLPVFSILGNYRFGMFWETKLPLPKIPGK